MILVLMGTNPYPFNRLIQAVDELAEDTLEEVIVQSGSTPPPKGRLNCFPFASHSQLMKWIEQAEVVVAQGGFGSLSDCISVGARVVAVPRSIDLGESIDEQKELVMAFSREGLVIPVYDISELRSAVELARQAVPQQLSLGRLPEHIAATINKFLGDS